MTGFFVAPENSNREKEVTMKLVVVVALVRLLAELAGKKAKDKKKKVNGAQANKTQHPAGFALR